MYSNSSLRADSEYFLNSRLIGVRPESSRLKRIFSPQYLTPPCPPREIEKKGGPGQDQDWTDINTSRRTQTCTDLHRHQC